MDQAAPRPQTQPPQGDFYVAVVEALGIKTRRLEAESNCTLSGTILYGSQLFTFGHGFPKHTANCIWSNSFAGFKREGTQFVTVDLIAEHNLLTAKIIGRVQIDLDMLKTDTRRWYEIQHPKGKKKHQVYGNLYIMVTFGPDFPNTFTPQKSGLGIFFPEFNSQDWKTGDMLLFAGLGSKMICTLSQSQYSHSALVVKPSDFDPHLEGITKLLLIEACTNSAMDDYTKAPRKGVMLRDLEQKVRTYNGFAVWFFRLKQPLQGQDMTCFLDFCRDFHSRNVQYDDVQSKARMLGKCNVTDLDKVYCSEFVAQALMEGNRISRAEASSNYLPVDLARESCFEPAVILKYLVKHSPPEK